MMKAYASSGQASTTRTADDRAYTALAMRQAAAAGVRNPGQYVRNNVNRSNQPGGRRPANRGRVLNAIGGRAR